MMSKCGRDSGVCVASAPVALLCGAAAEPELPGEQRAGDVEPVLALHRDRGHLEAAALERKDDGLLLVLGNCGEGGVISVLRSPCRCFSQCHEGF